MDILAELNGVFRQLFGNGIPTVTRQTTADDIEDWDSLTHMMLIAAVEKKFGVKFPLGELPQLQNVGDMTDSIEKKLAR
jgi:acyl carrier protein